MSDRSAVSITGLGKRYRLGQTLGRQGQVSFRELIAGSARRLATPGRRAARPAGPEEFWALRDVSFDVGQGDVVGIVGRNGAGKSTLLKVLSRITEPTEGRVRIRGRIASLLEVGTGFHPELTGRENIYLNGAILGMSRSEVRTKFDEIVSFAEVARFLETPVKRYSSGMYVRLAFAVAAHLEPEILIVDEVLAVGDQEFQAKCLGKMRDVRNSGRTVLFVSHNLAAVRALCNRAVLLESGRVAEVGPTGSVLDAYVARQQSASEVIEPEPPRDGRPRIARIRLMNPALSHGDVLALELDVAAGGAEALGLDVRVHDEMGSPIAYASTHMSRDRVDAIAGTARMRITIGPLALGVGRYDVYFTLMKPHVEDVHDVREPLRFEVVHADPGGTGFEFRQSYGLGAFSAPLRVEPL